MSLFTVSAPIEGIFAELLLAFSIIVVGIFAEGRLGRKYVYINLVGLLVTVFTSSIDLLVLPLLVVYIVIGLVIAYYKKSFIYALFGSKVYGSLLLAVAIVHTPSVQEWLSTLLSSQMLSANVFVGFYYFLLFVFWVILGVFVFIFLRIVKR